MYVYLLLNMFVCCQNINLSTKHNPLIHNPPDLPPVSNKDLFFSTFESISHSVHVTSSVHKPNKQIHLLGIIHMNYGLTMHNIETLRDSVLSDCYGYIWVILLHTCTSIYSSTTDK